MKDYIEDVVNTLHKTIARLEAKHKIVIRFNYELYNLKMKAIGAKKPIGKKISKTKKK